MTNTEIKIAELYKRLQKLYLEADIHKFNRECEAVIADAIDLGVYVSQMGGR